MTDLPPDDLDALREATWGLFASASRLRSAVLAQAGLGENDIAILSELERLPRPMTARVLGARLRLSSGTSSAVIDRLQRAGLVSRTRNPHDRRSSLLALEPAGIRTLRAVRGQLDEVLRTVIAAGTDREQLLGTVAALQAGIERIAARQTPLLRLRR